MNAITDGPLWRRQSSGMTHKQLKQLALIAMRMSIRSPLPTEANAHHIYVQMPIRYIRQIREVMEAAGLDWRKECQEYKRQMREARKRLDDTGELKGG